MNALLEFIGRAVKTTAFRLAVAAVSAFLIGAAAVAALLFWQTNAVLTEQAIATIRAEGEALQREADKNGLKELVETVAVLSRPEGPGLYFLRDATGAKLAGNLNRVPPELQGTEAGALFRYEKGEGAAARERFGVAISVPVKPGVVLLIGRDVEEQKAYAARLKRIFLWGFAALGLAGVLAGLAVSRLALGRIETITAASRNIMAGDLARRIPLSGSGDELDELAGSLNEMLERIEQLMTGLKEVSDNIAHDLKTPLNRMRNRAEAALRDPRGAGACREGLERTIEDADELIKTFNALLLIARLEAGAIEESAESFDLGQLVCDVAEFYEPVAEESGQALSIDAAAGPQVKANRQLVGQAVANLIDNALKYGGRPAEDGMDAAGGIDIKVSETEGGAEISVADHGPGISAADRERVVKRFVRLEESRTRPGTGLGLSLVAAVARLHGGGIRLEDNQPGLRAVLVLPRKL